MAQAPVTTGSDRTWRSRLTISSLIKLCEDVFHYGVALLLLAIGALVLYHTSSGLVASGSGFATRIVDSINGVLLGIIVLELMTTVVAHFEHAGLQLKPFLIIGIISAVEHPDDRGPPHPDRGGQRPCLPQLADRVGRGDRSGARPGDRPAPGRRGEQTVDDRVEDD